MNLTNYLNRVVLLFSLPLLLSACGGGGGGGGDAESMQAPYLISSPQVNFSPNLSTPSEYDVTVTIEADGPAGIFSASVWLIDINALSNSYFLDLAFAGGNIWTGTTNPLIPMAAGTYRVDSITLHDADPMGASFLTGWYFEMPIFSTTHYYVDQRDIYSSPDFNMIALGISNIPMTIFTMP